MIERRSCTISDTRFMLPLSATATIEYTEINAKLQNGDLAVYLQSSAFEIEFQDERYVIVPHSAILMLIRDENLFD